MNTSRVRNTDMWSSMAWALKLGGWSIAALTGVYLWPVLQKVGEDHGLFGSALNRFAPIADIAGGAVFWSSLVATFAAAVGFFYGRWLLGAMKEDGPDSRFRVTSPSELADTLSLQVLGHTYRLGGRYLPMSALLDELWDVRSGYSEALNRIAVCMLRWVKAFDGRVIAITGDRPAVGKTSTAVGLARALTSFGKRVLVIDGDLRSPSLHRWAELENSVGFTNVAIGPVEPTRAIRTAPRLGFDVLTAGPIPPAPAAVVAQSKATVWVRRLLEVYDYILIDTPPLAFSEVLQVVDFSDALIYVVEHGSNLRQSRTVLDQLRRLNETPAATIMSKIPVRGGTVTWGGYDYFYDYNYGSTAADKEKVPDEVGRDEPAVPAH
jgi:capsular exopolysaccharide synthesis family protein